MPVVTVFDRPSGRTDRHDGRADLQALRRGETRDRQVSTAGLTNRQVGGLVVPTMPTVEASVRQGDLNLPPLIAGEIAVVGDDVTLRVDDAGAGAAR